ncbi:hypothetical protein EBX31_04785 [bacterium]|nr:hypothetical protein [bacterium]
MKDVATGGRTVLFVSHNMTAIRSLCTRAILMNSGKVQDQGEPEKCIYDYLKTGVATPAEKVWEKKEAPGNAAVVFRGVRAVSRRTDGKDPSLFDTETAVDVEIDLEVFAKSRFHITLHFITDQGAIAFSSLCIHSKGWLDFPKVGPHKFICHVPGKLLNEGKYFIRVSLVENRTKESVVLEDVIGFDVKDFVPREVGDWQGREPGPVKPILQWKFL